jgi:hypothetical protein
VTQAFLAVGALFLLVFTPLAVLAWRRPLLARFALRESTRRKGQFALLVVGLMAASASITASLVGADSSVQTLTTVWTQQLGAVDLTVTEEQEPNYTIKQTPFDAKPGSFHLQVLGRSNGFDPRDPANGYLMNLNGKVLLWDCPAYLHQHLKRMQLDPKRIDAFVLSHVHEDHIDVTESLRDPPHELYATPEVYYSLLVKLAAVYGCSLEDAKKFHKWHPIDPSKPMDVLGAKVTFFHSVHAIPAIGCRMELTVNGKRGLLHLSGDHLSTDALTKMHEQGGVSKRRFDFINSLIHGDETLVLMDAGGGAIHGDYRDYLNLKTRVAYMHTGLIQEQLPAGKELITSGEVLNLLPG